jgi:hypothetical protein
VINKLLSHIIDELNLTYDDALSAIKETINKYSEEPEYAKKSKYLIDSLAKVNANRPENSSANFRISSLLKTLGYQVELSDIVDAENGKSGCKKVLINGIQHFIKPFSYIQKDGEIGINPKEPFLYKVLEYMNLGPETTLLIGGGSSFGGTAGLREGNYIMTKGEDLFFDGQIANYKMQREAIALNVEFYDYFKKDSKESAIELSCASLIKGLLSIGDVYPNNTENYGISKKDNKFKFIDHLPGNNGEFVDKGEELNARREQEYSPRTSMQSLCADPMYKGNLSDLSESHNKWKKFALAKEVNERVFGEDRLQNAINNAKNDILSHMEKRSDYFVENANEYLQEYINKIQKNIENYKQTEYAKSGGIGK